MKESFWKGNGKNSWVAKAVISSTGHAVARNYLVNGDDRDTRLRFGDLGITMRLDRKLDGMTPEQRLAAQGLAEEMFRDLMRVLGKEVIEGSGIPAGSFIEIGDDVYRVVKETKLGLHLEPLGDGFLWAREFHTWSKMNQVRPVPMNEARRIAIRAFVNSSCFNWDPDVHRKFLGLWGERALAQLFFFSQNDNGLDFHCDREDAEVTEDMRPCMSLIQDLKLLRWISEESPEDLIRNIAEQLLLERAPAPAATPDP